MLIGEIAINCMSTSSETAKMIEDFLIEKLNFKKLKPTRERSESPQRNKRSVATDEDDEYYDEEIDSDSELEMDEKEKAFMEFILQKTQEDDNFQLAFDEILSALDQELPMIPGEPIV